MSDKKVIVKVDNLTKTFRIPLEASSGIKQKLINILKGRKGYRVFTPLKNISFEVNEGDFFGIVGRNGSGKSTLLKTIAGIYTPNGGAVHVNGKLVPFIELGVGFNPELTGRENIFLNGALLGFSHKEMEAMYDEIVDFAELGDFMEERLKNYSSGMQVRLAFSIAIKAKGDILILDEVLAVGDAAFQQKCYSYFEDLKKNNKTVILVTHDMSAVSRFCNRALLLDDGAISLVGLPRTVASKYLEENYNTITNDKSSGKLLTEKPRATISKITTNVKKMDPGEVLSVSIYYNNPESMPIHFGFQIFGHDGAYIFGTNTRIDGQKVSEDKNGKVSIDVKLDLVPGLYYLTVATMNGYASEAYDYRTNIEKIIVNNKTEVGGVAFLNHKWKRDN